jgi:hypothetical protein
MFISNNKDIAIKLDRLATATISSALIPVVTSKGIVVGKCTIKPIDGFFTVYKNNIEQYKTYTKSAALILAGSLNKVNVINNISRILDADRLVHSIRNDIEIYKYHYVKAEKRGDDIKRGIMAARYESAQEKYKEAKSILKDSYSKLF